MHNLGHTRSDRQLTHLLQTPDTFVGIPLPGFESVTVIVHAAPALGAAFSHHSFAHLATNMIGLWFFGVRLHDVKDLDAAHKLLTTGKDGLLALPDKPETYYPDDVRTAAAKAQDAVMVVERSLRRSFAACIRISRLRGFLRRPA